VKPGHSLLFARLRPGNRSTHTESGESAVVGTVGGGASSILGAGSEVGAASAAFSGVVVGAGTGPGTGPELGQGDGEGQGTGQGATPGVNGLRADGPTREIFRDDVLLAECCLERPLSLQGCPICNR